ncbi:hypothetical protein Y032_0816g2501 [Ancylostoma ceylanicum]|uniref:Uncharacterized protein n=1 Tax=Ancylostoma ceylanicum TaxID=53326 RepID=A0A016WBI1_9BILA|nr:hypothetical protein Y032_0816g2501 [Ancylostoma ceylanicum]
MDEEEHRYKTRQYIKYKIIIQFQGNHGRIRDDHYQKKKKRESDTSFCSGHESTIPQRKRRLDFKQSTILLSTKNYRISTRRDSRRFTYMSTPPNFSTLNPLKIIPAASMLRKSTKRWNNFQ